MLVRPCDTAKLFLHLIAATAHLDEAHSSTSHSTEAERQDVREHLDELRDIVDALELAVTGSARAGATV